MMQPTSGIPEKKEQIVELYNKNIPAKAIAEKVGVNYLTLRKYIAKWKKDGSLPAGRCDKTHNYPKTRKSPQKKAEEETLTVKDIQAESKEEEPIESIENLDSRIDQSGEVDGKNTSIMQYNHNLVCWNEEPVYCTREVSLKCVWGTNENSPNLCDFLCRNGHSRGCHWKECHRFVRVTKETPKARSPFIV